MMRSSVVRPTFPIWGLTSHNVYLIASLKSNPVYQPTVSQRIHENMLSLYYLSQCWLSDVVFLQLLCLRYFRFHFWGFVPLMCCLVDVGWPLTRNLSRFFVLLYKGYVSLFLLTYLLCCLPHVCYCIKLFGATFKVCLSRLWLFDYFNGKVRRFFKISY